MSFYLEREVYKKTNTHKPYLDNIVGNSSASKKKNTIKTPPVLQVQYQVVKQDAEKAASQLFVSDL